MPDVPPPPPGFTLDTHAGAPPPPPPGFTLDGPRAALKPTAEGEPKQSPPAALKDLFGPDYLSASAEGLKDFGKTLFNALVNPGSEGVKASAELLGSVIEGTGAFVGEPLAPPAGKLADAAPRTAPQALLQDFERTGVTPNVPTIGQGRAAGLASNLARSLPFSPVTGAVQKSLGETGAAAERAAAGLGKAATPTDAAEIIRNAVNKYVEDRTQAARDYGRFFGLMQAAPPAVLPNTVETLQKIMGRFKTEPELSGLFTKEPIKRLTAILTPRTEQIAAKTSPIVGANGMPIETVPARTVQRGGELPMSDLREIRSQIGALLDDQPFGPEAIDKGQLRSIYAALTKDMYAAAVKQGPEATKALATATFNYGTRMRLRDTLQPLLRSDASESTFTKLNNAAKGADTGLLRSVKKVTPPGDWNEFGAAVVRRLGEPTPGAKDVLEAKPFSGSSYVTNWNKLTPEAKDLLFGPDLPGTPRSNLEALSRVAQAQKNVGRLANASHSGEMAVIAGTVEEVTRKLSTGEIPWAAALGLGGSYGVSKLLMSPGFTRWLYRLPKVVQATGGGPGTEAAAMAALQRAVVPMPEEQRPVPPVISPGIASAISAAPPL